MLLMFKGVRVVVTSGFPVEKLNSSAVREEWVKNKTKYALDNFADGINIDIEGPVSKNSKEVTLLTKLVKLTAESFKENIPGAQVMNKQTELTSSINQSTDQSSKFFILY